MAGKGVKYRLFILVIFALAVAGCDSSVVGGEGGGGAIGGTPPSSTVYYGLLVDFQRSSYTVGQSFQLADLSVILVDSDGGRKVLGSGYSVYVIEDTGRPDAVSNPVTNSGYRFDTAGEKAIQVKYIDVSLQSNDLTVQYLVNVESDDAAGSQSSGIVVIWET